jgi:hypothetical protein
VTAAPGWVLLLESMLRQSISLPGALCRGHGGGPFDGSSDDDVAEASAICSRCPEIQRFRDWASSIPKRKLSGVVAGEHREWYSHGSLRKPRRPRKAAS